MSNTQDLRTLVQQLLQLTGLSVAELARRSEVHRPNFIAWLSGKENVLSEKRQLKVCEFLGWRFGRLRRDMVHRWEVGGDLSVCAAVLNAFEGHRTDVTRTLFQAEGGETEKGVVILVLTHGESPLVILIRRPLGYDLPQAITAQRLGRGFDLGEHYISAQEWRNWWQANAKLDEPESYINAYGRKMLDAAKRELTVLHQEQTFADDIVDDYAAILDVTAEQQAWLALLSKAIDSGMSFEEVSRRAKSALNLDE